MTLRSGDLLANAVDALDGLGVDLISIMHTDVPLIDACLDVMFERWTGPIGVYAHSWAGIDAVDYAVLSEGWLARGVNLVGGCCGTLPDHIVELAKLDAFT